MNEENLSILRALKQNIEEIAAPLEAAQLASDAENKEKAQSGLDFIMSELTMIVLLLTGTDSNVAERELELLNDMRRVVYGAGIPELRARDYIDLCREFLQANPESRMTVDHCR